MDNQFRDRSQAGRELAQVLAEYRGRPDVIVLALPRGGVPVGFEVASALGVPLDVFVVRKVGVPWHTELAMGAIAAGGARFLNEELIDALGVSDAEVERAIADEEREVARRERMYRDDRPFPDLRGRTVIVVDDGLATGSTMQAAVGALRELDAGRIVVAVPVAPPDVVRIIADEVDEALALRTPEPFYAVGLHYHDFRQTTDDDVRRLLARAAAPEAEARPEVT